MSVSKPGAAEFVAEVLTKVDHQLISGVDVAASGKSVAAPEATGSEVAAAEMEATALTLALSVSSDEAPEAVAEGVADASSGVWLPLAARDS